MMWVGDDLDWLIGAVVGRGEMAVRCGRRGDRPVGHGERLRGSDGCFSAPSSVSTSDDHRCASAPAGCSPSLAADTCRAG